MRCAMYVSYQTFCLFRITHVRFVWLGYMNGCQSSWYPLRVFPCPLPVFWREALHIAMPDARVWHLCPCVPCVRPSSFVTYGVIRLETACKIIILVLKLVVSFSRSSMPHPRSLDWYISYCDNGSSNVTLMFMCSMCSSKFVRYVWCNKAGNGM